MTITCTITWTDGASVEGAIDAYIYSIQVPVKWKGAVNRLRNFDKHQLMFLFSLETYCSTEALHTGGTLTTKQEGECAPFGGLNGVFDPPMTREQYDSLKAQLERNQPELMAKYPMEPYDPEKFKPRMPKEEFDAFWEAECIKEEEAERERQAIRAKEATKEKQRK